MFLIMVFRFFFREVQYVVLSNIASLSVSRKEMFEPFLKSFYVHANDPTHVKLLKVRPVYCF